MGGDYNFPIKLSSLPPLLNRWIESQAANCRNELTLRAYSSRLLGADPSLVLHGGGNTSVKLTEGDATTLWVKGSGSDLAQVTENDFTPLDLPPVRALLDHDSMSNEQMMAALAPCVRKPESPKPSIETLLHAALPYRYVEHTHADAILAVTNTTHGEEIAERIFGDLAPRVPFRHSGFDLARTSREVYSTQHTARSIGLILMRHGVFAFGESARQAYENMLTLVGLAEHYLRERNAWTLPCSGTAGNWNAVDIAELRGAVSRAAGFPLLARMQDDPYALAFANSPHLADVLAEGPATPQHAVFIKRAPMLGRDIEAYVRSYRHYIGERNDAPDPAPRVVLDRNFGALVLGFGQEYLRMADDIFRHGREIMTRASLHDRYRGLPPEAVLDAEIHYGGFEKRILAQRESKDALRGTCIVLALDAAPLSDLVRTSLQNLGAAVVNASDGTTAKQTVGLFGGVDALIVDATWAAIADDFAPLLPHSPIGGKLIWTSDGAPPYARAVDTVRVRPELSQILRALEN